jgi:hypothetical protein
LSLINTKTNARADALGRARAPRQGRAAEAHRGIHFKRQRLKQGWSLTI